MRKLGRWDYAAARVVEPEHAAEALPASDGALSDERGLGRDEFIPQSLVSAARRFFEPSDFLATNRRYQRRIVSGVIAEGLPYQTLIASLLHKYASGCLKEV